MGSRETFSVRRAVKVAAVFFVLISASTIQSGLLEEASRIFTPALTRALCGQKQADGFKSRVGSDCAYPLSINRRRNCLINLIMRRDGTRPGRAIVPCSALCAPGGLD